MATSKNNPNARKANIVKLFQGKEVKPVKYIGPHGSYIAAQFDNGELITDPANANKPLPYKKVVA